jgi:predicted porin
MYGIVDAGFVHERGGVNGSVNKIGSGVGSYSRLGFRGAEELSSDLSAIFTLETGFRVDDGTQDAPGSIFNRQAFVGIKSKSAGALTLGRQYTPYYLTLTTVADPFGTGYAGSTKNLFPTAGTGLTGGSPNTRTSNTILYTSPTVSGLSAELAYAAGEQAQDESAGRQLGAAVTYANGPLNVRVAYNNRNTDNPAAVAVSDRSVGISTNTIIAANYDFGIAKLYAAYEQDKGPQGSPLANNSNPYGAPVGSRPVASTDAREALIGANIKAGPGNVLVSYTKKQDRDNIGLDQDASQWAIGYLHPVSKRTTLYAAYAKINNKNGAGYTVGNNTEVGSGDSAVNLGVRHSF